MSDLTASQERLLDALRAGIADGELIVRIVPLKEVRPQLSPRQTEAIEWLGEGLTTKEIAVRMGCTFDTAKNHCVGLYRHLGVDNRHGAVAKAFRLGILT